MCVLAKKFVNDKISGKDGFSEVPKVKSSNRGEFFDQSFEPTIFAFKTISDFFPEIEVA